jgi:hypothetical protein
MHLNGETRRLFSVLPSMTLDLMNSVNIVAALWWIASFTLILVMFHPPTSTSTSGSCTMILLKIPCFHPLPRPLLKGPWHWSYSSSLWLAVTRNHQEDLSTYHPIYYTLSVLIVGRVKPTTNIKKQLRVGIRHSKGQQIALSTVPEPLLTPGFIVLTMCVTCVTILTMKT